MRVEMKSTAHTAVSGHASTRRLASTASFIVADEAADGEAAEEAADEERARVVAQASSAQQHQREEQGQQKAAAVSGEKQVLFVLAQKDFSVTTKQYERSHCGPMLLELTALGGAGCGDGDEGEEADFAAAASGAGVGVTPTHAAQQAGKGKKAKGKGASAAPRAFFLALGVGGFRIVQTGSGNQHAEYNVILCLNAATYVVWRRYSQFAALMEAARAAHGDSQLPQTWEAWAALERRRRWLRCLSVPYLAGKCAGLEAFLQALVAESLSPALLLRFVASDEPAGGSKR